MDSEFNDVRLKRIHIVIKIVSPTQYIKRKVQQPKYNVVLDWNG